jgi:hypothetical protein
MYRNNNSSSLTSPDILSNISFSNHLFSVPQPDTIAEFVKRSTLTMAAAKHTRTSKASGTGEMTAHCKIQTSPGRFGTYRSVILTF